MKKVLFIVFFVTIFSSILADSIALDHPNLRSFKSFDRELPENTRIGCMIDEMFWFPNETYEYIAYKSGYKKRATNVFRKYSGDIAKEVQNYLFEVGDKQIITVPDLRTKISYIVVQILIRESYGNQNWSDYRVLADRVARGLTEFGSDRCPYSQFER